MPTVLPYLAAPGSIKTALERIRTAATPSRVTRDFVTTKLQIKGGTGSALIPFLKKIGFIASDGSPTDLYKRFRNPSTGGGAVAEAIKFGYAPLSQVNEYFYDLGDKELQDLILQVTGAEKDNAVAKLTFSTLKIIKGFANFNSAEIGDSQPEPTKSAGDSPATPSQRKHDVGLNLSYTINLNLPATTDQAVFNAIFRSLKEHLLSEGE